jgi:large subunit ribosomal protein L18e
MMKPNPEDRNLVELIVALKASRKAIWKRVGELLNKPKRSRIEVNVSKIAKYAKEGITVIVPGKVLGDGVLDKPVVVAAYRFSQSATESISGAGGKAISIKELYESGKDKAKDIIILS